MNINKIKKTNKFAIVFNAIFIIIILHLFFVINNNNTRISMLQDDRYKMLKLADKLRQSSDDLTHFARTYVITFDKQFEKQYFDTLGIRNGLKNRPINYDKIYWDLEKTVREKRHPEGEKISLKNMMKRLPYTKKESALLSLSEKNSNDLVNLEVKAFNAMKGLYEDSYGKYTIKDNVNQKLAIKLLHSKDYYAAKHKIMNPIDEFIIILDDRTQAEIINLQKVIVDKLNILYLVIVIYILISIVMSFLLKKVNENIKTDLSNQIEEALEQNTKQQQVLQQQSKMASMGEMIGAIAHQWRQPLNELGISIQNLKYNYKSGAISEEFIKEFIENNKKTIMFMSKTIDDFRSFFRIDKEKHEFNVKEATLSVISMQSAQLKSHEIDISLTGDEFAFNGLQSEYQQVILNIVNNAKDAFIENKTKNPKIEIILEDRTVSIKDNAGGIPQEVIDRIFEPYFTTKEQGKGTGMGLYMSKMIIEDNLDGKLSVVNKDDGACFVIKFPEH